LSARAVRLHVCVVVVVAVCLVLGWWQLDRALSGNTLSWVYTIEWPFFAGYAVYMWWKLLHETEGEPGVRHSRSRSVTDVGKPGRKARSHRDDAAREADEEKQLAEYNRYLADLQDIDRSRRN
jgi:DNA-binding transcriptional regulator of glucitol operon